MPNKMQSNYSHYFCNAQPLPQILPWLQFLFSPDKENGRGDTVPVWIQSFLKRWDITMWQYFQTGTKICNTHGNVCFSL